MIKLDKVMQDFEMAKEQLKEIGTCITIFDLPEQLHLINTTKILLP